MSRVKEKFGFCEPAHRLDMATSGIILFALSKAADKELKRQFREREPKKYYQALVWGHLEQDSGEINLPMIVIGKIARVNELILYLVKERSRFMKF